ncbi:LCP family protein [Leptothoe spongobia]|uniref:LCP family protein n=1 Tax=Leptothoe spongobia TAU-MAC 1115 TaxID=1967444 RepID=A0A947GHT7_9CYAN|nr:LCP family protein [Leptothoe spongobia]MBT9315174.1 LCP family protein [Leptothoe spongobia TAU-MAC 1115]
MSIPPRKKQPVRQYPKQVTVTQQRQKRGWIGIPKWAWLTVALASVATISAGTGALLAVSMNSQPLLQSQLSPEEAAVFSEGEPMLSTSSLRLPRLTRPVNILLLGVKVLTSDLDTPVAGAEDLGYHALVNSFEGLSDTMLLLRFNPRTGQLVVMSVPRDTRALVNGVLTKINEANLDGGPALTAESISDLLGGVAIDRYVRINVQGVEKLIDALGGVTVNVPKDMKYQDDSQHLYINLKAGQQKLNGDQALQFLRFRYDDNGDIGRVQRQQTMMRAVIEQTLNPATIARLPKILSVIQSHVDTNLSVEELVALVGYGSQTNRSDVQMLMLPGNFSSPEEFALSYWLPSYAQIDTMVEQYFGLESAQFMEATSPSYLRVVIQDSTGDDVAIQSMIDTLYDSGYRNVIVGHDLNELIPETRIVAQRGDRASASRLQQFLRIGEVRVESTGNLDSDITIQLGEDWLGEHGAAL